MNWTEGLSRAIDYAEKHLNEEIDIGRIAEQAFASASHFQFIFHVVTGVTIGEYIRNRRLSLAAEAILGGGRIIDAAFDCGYDTQESFSKAFTRFHGVPPSKITRENARTFKPMCVRVIIEGGFAMNAKFEDRFSMYDRNGREKENYGAVVDWARQARGRNPGVFDALTEWLLDDAEWTEGSIGENQQILGGVLSRFKGQNARLREYLTRPELAEVVNAATFRALDEFDAELDGEMISAELKSAVAKMNADFSAMTDRALREIIAGGKTGPTGTASVETFGYINSLKECDAQVQWTLFMPDLVKKQQDGFRVESFEYKKLPAMRFIGAEIPNDPAETFKKLDAMKEYGTEIGSDILFTHHGGMGVDIAKWHGVWGRFMREGAPVPEGLIGIDLVPTDDGNAFAPFISQFAYAVFAGDSDAMHKTEGYDGDAMYDVTRNIILGQGVEIPYPRKYWTAAVCRNGWDKPSDAYMFAVKI